MAIPPRRVDVGGEAARVATGGIGVCIAGPVGRGARTRRVVVGVGALLASVLLASCGSGGAPSASASVDQSTSRPCVLRAELRGVVSAGAASYLESAVAAAERQRCTGLMVPLDTPGGMLEETRRIVRAFLDSPVPIVVHVSPSAARAGSAGAFIAMAAHVAAMAPGSSIGAAHPVMGPQGGDPGAGNDAMGRKIENDVASLARAIAGQRERNVEWAESAVRESSSATAAEAKELGVIDLVIASEDALLAAIDGRAVRLATGEEVVLRTRGAAVVDHPMTVQQWTLTKLGDPNLAYALLMLGMFALVFELFTPGIGVAGIIGAFSIVLGAIGLNMLPVGVGGVILIVAAFALFVAELYVTSYGLLAAAGVGSLLLGAALLVDRSDPELFADASVQLSWGVVVPLAVVLGAAAILLGAQVARARTRRSPTGAEGLLGAVGVALSDVGATGGSVRLQGELWQAVSDEPVPERTPVRVIDVRGLTLRVERAPEPHGGVS